MCFFPPQEVVSVFPPHTLQFAVLKTGGQDS